jgi:uncharacterized protein (TIGR00369 family)
MTLLEIRAFLAADFAPLFADGAITVETAAEGAAVLRLRPDARHLRPGGIVSGPTLMTLADTAAYAALLSLPAEARMAVTTNLSVSFLRGGEDGGPVIAVARVIKAGRRLSTIVCEARSEDGRALAHATLTYAMPLSE